MAKTTDTETTKAKGGAKPPRAAKASATSASASAAAAGAGLAAGGEGGAAGAGEGAEPGVIAGMGGRETAATSETLAARGRRQVKVGRVVSNKMNMTVIVTVESTATHRLYHRYMKRTSKFAAHDAENRCQVGDVVEIVSSRPLSKTKRWRVREILKRAE
jgi:small subunit ribosomal protein S17